MSMKDIISPFLGIKSKFDRGDYSKGLGDIDLDLGFATLRIASDIIAKTIVTGKTARSSL